MEVSKTICPVQDYVHAEAADAATTENLFLEVATASERNVSFSLVLQREHVSIGYVPHVPVATCQSGLCASCLVPRVSSA